jgi:hypothetical protein
MSTAVTWVFGGLPIRGYLRTTGTEPWTSRSHRWPVGYPRPGIEALELSKPYVLIGDWPKPWPNSDLPGVYIFLQDEEIMYIGKASCEHVLGARLGAYFKRASNGEATLKDKRCEGVHSVVTIGILKSHAFEASALEEFLISMLGPVVNQQGVRASYRH